MTGDERERIAKELAGDGPDAIEAAEEFGALLALGDVGLTVRGGRIFGSDSSASADVDLSNGETLTFESLRDVGSARTLALEVAAQTGAVPKLKGPDALRAVTLLRALAEHTRSATEDDMGREYGSDYLQIAPTAGPVPMTEQAARWRAFSELANLRPEEDVEGLSSGRLNSYAFASNTSVIVDLNGTRYVRCGWFCSYVRREVGGVYTPRKLATLMGRVGWRRPGGEGLIKATCPTTKRTLSWSFYVVSADWGE